MSASPCPVRGRASHPASGRAGGRARPWAGALVTLALVGGLVACGGDDEGDDDRADETPSATPTPTASATPTGPTETATPDPEPEPPATPAFAPGDKGRKRFAEHVVATWGYALATNDARALTGLSPSRKQPCRGCKEIERELRQRDREGWAVDFPGARVRRTTLDSDGDRILATTVADIPASRSYFEDGTFRNDNEAHRGAKFLVDLRIDGEGKKRRYVLLAFSVR